MTPEARFKTCRNGRGYQGHEAIISGISGKLESIAVMADDAVETYGVREECMGTRPAQEVPTDLLI